MPKVIAPPSDKPAILRGGSKLYSVRAFSIVRNEKSTFQYLVTLTLDHEGEINVNHLTTDNSEVITFEFAKHQEQYKGSFVNYAIKWQENEKPSLILHLVGVKL